MRGQYEQQVTLLHDKLHWYAENQQLLTDREALVKQQATIIAEMQNRLQEGGREGSQQRAANLEKQNLQKQVRGARLLRLPPLSLARFWHSFWCTFGVDLF